MSGLEQLMNVGQNQMFWVGSDGSGRAYNKVSSTVWRGVNRARPDSIIYDSSLGQYVRIVPGGVQVRFNSNGEHVATRDRVGRTTSISYLFGKLDRISLPLPTGGATHRRYTFGYSGGALSLVTSYLQITTISGSSGRINSITDPDGAVTAFSYADASSKLITAREVTHGAATARRTEFEHTAGNHVRLARQLLDAAPHIVLTLRPQESAGLENSGVFVPVVPTTAHTWVDGPRASMADTTRFYLNAYSQPDSVRDAVGAWTKVVAWDAVWPALPKKVRGPSGMAATAVYDAKARVTSTTDSATLGTTTIEWANASCPDFPTRITQPEGDFVRFGYAAGTCNRSLQEDGRGSSTRVNFSYLADGRLSTVTPPHSGLLTFAYDPQLGNVASVSQGGVTRTFQYDDEGRLTRTTTPVGTTSTRTQRIGLDAMGRDTLVVDSTAGAVVRTRKVYLSGLLRSVATSTTPDPSAIGTVTTTYTHDRAGRVTREQGGGRWVNWGYDLAGNVTSGGPFPATRTYDGANRLLTEGTSSFDYDLSGNLIRADNPSARIRRGYDAAGRLVADTQWIAQFDTTTRAPNGFTSGLLYALHYGYDRNDRLKWTKYETGLRPATGYDSIGYSYDPNAGMLASVRDIAGNIYAFTYDNEARPTQLNRALTGGGWVRDSLFYDTVSRLQRRVVRSSALTGAVLDETMTFDKVDRLTYESANGHSFDYSALEGLNSGNAAGGTETFDIDPLGRRQRSTDRIGQSPTTAYYYYDAGIGTMDYSVRLSFYADTTKYRFTSFGMQDQTERRTQLGLDQPGMPAPRLERTTNYWYSANRLTRVVELVDTVTYDGGKPYPLYESYWKQEGYWYDALGRRVLTWSWKAPNCSQKDRVSGCKNTVTRAIWSGDQLAYEIRTTFSSPNSDVTGGAHYGRVGYLHLAAIDRPIALWKGTQVVHPIINARGNFPKGTCGTALCSTSQIDFPGARMTLFGVDYNPPTQGPVS